MFAPQRERRERAAHASVAIPLVVIGHSGDCSVRLIHIKPGGTGND
jgi:hypothetical protein